MREKERLAEMLAVGETPPSDEGTEIVNVVGVDHRFGQSALACSRWIACNPWLPSSGYGLDLAIQAEQGWPKG